MPEGVVGLTPLGAMVSARSAAAKEYVRVWGMEDEVDAAQLAGVVAVARVHMRRGGRCRAGDMRVRVVPAHVLPCWEGGLARSLPKGSR